MSNGGLWGKSRQFFDIPEEQPQDELDMLEQLAQQRDMAKSAYLGQRAPATTPAQAGEAVRAALPGTKMVITGELPNQGYTSPKGQKQLFAPKEEILDVAERVRAIPEIQALQKQQQEYEQLYQQETARPLKRPGIDLSPLYGLASPAIRETLLKLYKKPETEENRRAMLLKYKEKIEEGQRDLATKVLEAAGKFRTEQLTTAPSKPATFQVQTDTERKEVDYGKDVEKLQRKLEKITPLAESFNTLNSLIGGLENWKGADIPGAGATGAVPEIALSQEGLEVRKVLDKLRNDVLYARSGAAINESEYRRLSNALGAGRFSSDRALVTSLKNFGKELSAVMKQREAAFRGVHPKVVELYKSGGGITHEDIGTKAPNIAPAGPQPSGLTSEEQKRRDELRKKLGK